MNFRIIHYPAIESTNDLAKEMASQQAEEGTVLWTDFQTKGRGRFDRTWVSPRKKDLLFSIITRPRHMHVSQIPIVTHVAAESIVRVLQKECGLACQIKRPNDVMVASKKICGILVEGASKQQVTDYLVIGIGLNVNSRAPQLVEGATSLLDMSRRTYDREHLLQVILAEFDKQYQVEMGAKCER